MERYLEGAERYWRPRSVISLIWTRRALRSETVPTICSPALRGYTSAPGPKCCGARTATRKRRTMPSQTTPACDPCRIKVLSHLSMHFLEAISWRTKMVYLANPENPVGTHVGDARSRGLHKEMPSDALLVLDCAYEEYVDSPDHDGITDLVESADNIVISRTFSKISSAWPVRGSVGCMLRSISSKIYAKSRRPFLWPTHLSPRKAALKDRAHFDHVLEATVNGRRWLTECA